MTCVALSVMEGRELVAKQGVVAVISADPSHGDGAARMDLKSMVLGENKRNKR